MTLVTYSRLADSPPPERELLEVEPDGRARAWRSNGTVIGRFGGTAGDLAGLRAAVEEAAAGEPPAVAALPPGAALEIVETGGQTARLEARAPVDGPWAGLVELCRRELDAQIDAPLAAIAGVLGTDGGFRLEHRGSESLSLELGALAFVCMWREPQETAEERAAADRGFQYLEAFPGTHLGLGQFPGADRENLAERQRNALA